MATSLIKRLYTLLMLFGFLHGSISINAKDIIYIEPIYEKLNNNPSWMSNLTETYLIGIQCSDVFYLSSRYLKTINYHDHELINKLEFMSDQFLDYTTMHSSGRLLISEEFIDFQFDQVLFLYKNDIRANFSKKTSEFEGLIKRDMNACLGIIHLFESLPRKIT